MANTVNDHQIAEVYSDNGGASPGHELAHIFSYHFPGHPKRSGDVGKPADAFVEGFAGCFSFRGNGERAIADLRKRGDTALLPSIPEIIASSDYGTSAEPMALVQFLVDKDPERFKRFYVQVIADPNPAAIDQVCRKTYSMTLAELEQEWHNFLRSPLPKK
jgi:hypothetical protein